MLARIPQIAATASKRRPMLVVTGEAKPVLAIAPISQEAVSPPAAGPKAGNRTKSEASKPIALPADMGIGGEQHKTTQKRIKQTAEALGFLATIEKPIPNGSVDVLLERGGLTIACEISVTTTVDHEFGNVKKCLDGGFGTIAIISKPDRLRQIAEAVSTALGAETASRVGYYTPDDFITYLKGLPVRVVPQTPPVPTETVRRGRKVTLKARELTPEERRIKEALHLKVITEAMRSKPEPKGLPL